MSHSALAQNPAFWSRSGNSASANDFIGTLNNQPLIFKTNGIEGFRLMPNGNIGIGVTNPYLTLEVNGSIKSTGQIIANGFVSEGVSEFSFLHIKDSLKVGTTSIVLGGDPLSGDNTIYTNTGNLIIQSHSNDLQTIINANEGYVGIGTSNPQKKLHIQHNVDPSNENRILASYDYFMADTNQIVGTMYELDSVVINEFMPGSLRLETQVFGGSTSVWDIEPLAGTTQSTMNKLNFSDPQHGRTVMTLTSDGKYGNVGIGTMNPLQKLHIHNGNIYLTGQNSSMLFGNGEVVSAGWGNYGIEYLPENTTQNNAGGLNFWRPFGSIGGYQNFVMHIADNGNVGIGTGNPEHELDVCGTIRSQEIIVDLLGHCPDYVFEPEYNLTPIEDLKEFISRNKHLPDIPSAKQVEQDGINLGEMNMLLLKKIEELTLYIFELNERIIELENEKTTNEN